MADAPSLSLVTPRLVLRDFGDADLAAVHTFRSDPAVARFMDFQPESLEQALAWLVEVIAHNRERPRHAYNLAITRRADESVIGWIGIGRSSRYAGELGFGYMLHRDAWGQGYATEAARAIIDFGFSQLTGPRISAWCWAANAASARVLVKAGLRLDRCYQDIEPKNGQRADCLEYGLRAEEWRRTCALHRRDGHGSSD
ncbi:MAG: GNAT family N-acetyltransferase [Chloroflexi bacterium]|nr:GNAT family N-acetyltransferase [Chloroflexota bacterium]